jgi:adenosylcobinamide-GDP ribazoletransferase
MPQVKWDDDAMRLAIAFLPVAGAAVGCAVWGWQALCRLLGASAVLFAAVAAALPVFITGGIHMDGYCDTSDAVASWSGRERRLEILKDPHVGAFALIRLAMYVLIDFALLYELYSRGYDSGIGFVYAVSRCLAAWSAMSTPNAREDGMLAAFTNKTDRREAGVILALLSVITAACWVIFTFPYGIAGFLLCVPAALWYRGMVIKRFGGATGDTTGFFLQVLELALPAGTLAGGIISEWI